MLSQSSSPPSTRVISINNISQSLFANLTYFAINTLILYLHLDKPYARDATDAAFAFLQLATANPIANLAYR